MPSSTHRRRHAVVLGASLSGLLAARVLSAHFERVTVIERDSVTPNPTARKGQPQARHLHGLLASGLEQFCVFYPDLSDALRTAAGRLDDFAESMNWYTAGGYRRRLTLGKPSCPVSRPLLEALVRERTLALHNVSLRDDCAVQGLVFAGREARVVGVRLAGRGDGATPDELHAGLVVDCTGRGSRTPQWLAAGGFAAPGESVVRVDVGYASRLYRRAPDDPLGRFWTLITPDAPRETRFGGLFPIEGDRWIVSVGGWQGDHAPGDAQGFNAFVKQLPAPDIYQVISRSEPLSDVVVHKFPHSLRRHYERLARFPAGLLVLGDALCSFNPTYGQGMTSAALQAAVLDRLLAKSDRDQRLAPEFFKAAARIVDIPWQLAVGEDFRFPTTIGPKPFGIDLLNRYVGAVHRATLVDPEVCRAFLNVMNLIRQPASLLTPAIVLRVLRATLRTGGSARPVAAGAWSPAEET